jgi:hypothetical protein
MSQSSYIVIALLGGFVVWLAANNRLGVYTGVLWGKANVIQQSGPNGYDSGLNSNVNSFSSSQNVSSSGGVNTGSIVSAASTYAAMAGY